MLNTAFPPWPSFDEAEIEAVAAVMRSNKVNYWTGQEGRQFEREFASWSNSKHAIALANGTLALDLALQGLRIGAAYGGSASDEVIVTPRSFIASVSSVVNAGAVPIFADVEHDSGNISAKTIAPLITKNTRAFLPVHIGGWPCDIEAIVALANSHNVMVIEDCAQAHGAMVHGKSVGSFGHVGAWSFCQDKIMTTGGEGGMVTCDDEALWSRMWSFKDHGKNWDAVYNREHPPGFRWLHESIGTNWRMLEMQSVIGRLQLNKVKEWHNRRLQFAESIWSAVDQFDAFRAPRPQPGFLHAAYRAYVYVKEDQLAKGWTRDRIVAEVNALGVPCYQGTCSEIYLEKAFDAVPSRPPQRLPIARELGATSLMFLVHPTLETKHKQETIAAIEKVFAQAS